MPSKKIDDEVNSSPKKKDELPKKSEKTDNTIPVSSKRVSLKGQDPKK